MTAQQTAARNGQETYNDAKRTAANIKGDLRDASQSLSSDIYATTRDTAQKVGERLNEFAHDTAERFSDVRDVVSDKMSTATTTIRENPINASLIALGVGFLVGMLASRK